MNEKDFDKKLAQQLFGENIEKPKDDDEEDD